MSCPEKCKRKFKVEALPKVKFVVRAETPEKAAKRLIGELRAAIAELQKEKETKQITA